MERCISISEYHHMYAIHKRRRTERNCPVVSATVKPLVKDMFFSVLLVDDCPQTDELSQRSHILPQKRVDVIATQSKSCQDDRFNFHAWGQNSIPLLSAKTTKTLPNFIRPPLSVITLQCWVLDGLFFQYLRLLYINSTWRYALRNWSGWICYQSSLASNHAKNCLEMRTYHSTSVDNIAQQRHPIETQQELRFSKYPFKCRFACSQFTQ